MQSPDADTPKTSILSQKMVLPKFSDLYLGLKPFHPLIVFFPRLYTKFLEYVRKFVYFHCIHYIHFRINVRWKHFFSCKHRIT
jgi:hypothetical protein